MSHSHSHDNASHISVKGYLVGFVLSVILTVIPFWMVMGGAFTKQATLIGIFALAVVQIVVQLKYFLHLDFSKEGKLNTFSFLFTGMVIVLLVGLSIWIIYSADALMMR
ncbi:MULTISPECIES: cytochrome o ubiquinol oxidase subunit IV [Chromobacterium]|jgi:cytochrome o ubiquinol oxidase operon protein cyoD|uniref:Cytochrome bo(3) ubiquinol oxidase subunit 4 n=2 Tax=Chromobacterium TaxID=535 RepID=A0A1S1XBW0_9NEIS|nr:MULTISPECIES: cytochrome o ubiquinol oxidase subunit IV [Chromobacterium]MBM2882839.1 cytochrome o ubiquinol oxidase subunit IV [Chromobacterium amazonense]MDE1713151.1 cytochrome o ubiquinol oxidase subunit IV [Chromobacterium amazonense]MDQ4539587.1 cytochrome o ubiquinol oxidase subunit IV [Chromobacterium amazonense]OHX17472.1 cytochrome o ubiquinol oxidase subunit IV [Chromobacterium amazonense]POA99671.1 cytochrome o ubiquinol oxidase subunit IV [Chromobacterium sinusclupearum]